MPIPQDISSLPDHMVILFIAFKESPYCSLVCGGELWCWRGLLRVPWTARRLNQSILKEVNPNSALGRTDAEAEVAILWPVNVKNQLMGKDPDAGKD